MPVVKIYYDPLDLSPEFIRLMWPQKTRLEEMLAKGQVSKVSTEKGKSK